MRLLRPAAAAGLLLAVVIGPYFVLGAAVEHWSAGMIGGGGPSVAFAGMLLLALDALLPVPSSIVATAMGAMLGAKTGTLVNALGLTAGCALGFALGRTAAPAAGWLLGPRLREGFEAWIARWGIAALILCRAVPVLAEASVIALGAGRARVWPALAAAVAADLSLGAVYALAGAARGPEAMPAAPALAAALLLPAAAALLAWVAIARARPVSGSRASP